MLLLFLTACRASPVNPAHAPSAPDEKLEGCPSRATTDTEAAEVSDVTDVKLSGGLHRGSSPNDPAYGTTPTDAFFPAGIDAATRSSYGRFLTRMCEPSLWRMPEPSSVVLRFLWLRSFHPAMAFRVVQTAGTARLTASRLEQGVTRRELNLSQAEWERLLRALQDGDLATPVPERFGLDGAQWILEIRTKDSYRMIERWSPRVKGPDAGFRRLCELLLDLAGRDFIKGDVY